jgi:hypothetical protein
MTLFMGTSLAPDHTRIGVVWPLSWRVLTYNRAVTASPAEKYPLLLMVSEAANAELDLGGVLAPVS